MDIIEVKATRIGASDMFTGTVYIDEITDRLRPSRLRVNTVRFSPGARTAWHAHALGQTLHVLDGVGLVQARGGGIMPVRAGDTIYTPPGEWHWHGASSDNFMTHLAIWEAPESGAESEWGRLVTEEEYSMDRSTFG